jgi:hypothetical protein
VSRVGSVERALSCADSVCRMFGSVVVRMVGFRPQSWRQSPEDSLAKGLRQRPIQGLPDCLATSSGVAPCQCPSSPQTRGPSCDSQTALIKSMVNG